MITAEDLYTEQFEEDDQADQEQEVSVEDGNEAGGNESEAEEAPAENQDSTKKIVKPKRIVRNPQPKLNAETLKGKRGLTALPSYFARIKYKGKGHEEEDLTAILKTYEYWCHRLFPKYPFEECIEKIEKLGSKKAVVTHIKKIRLNMIDEDEPVINNDDSDAEENVNGDYFNDIDIPDVQTLPTPMEITEEQQEQIRLNRERAEQLRRERLQRAKERSESSLRESQNFTDDNFSQVSDMGVDNLEAESSNSKLPVELTEEQQERIRQNRERAQRLRQEKLEKFGSPSMDNSLTNTFNESLSQFPSTRSSDINIQNLPLVESDEDIDATSNEIQHSEEQGLGKFESSLIGSSTNILNESLSQLSSSQSLNINIQNSSPVESHEDPETTSIEVQDYEKQELTNIEKVHSLDSIAALDTNEDASDGSHAKQTNLDEFPVEPESEISQNQ